MLTLRDINTATNSYDGDLYSDIHKDVYGIRPRGVTFASTEEFDADFGRLCQKLDKKIKEENALQEIKFKQFTDRVSSMMWMENVSSREGAIGIIAYKEDISQEEFDLYGLELLEYHLGLKFGSIAKWLSEEVE
jgi:hypothetical protein